MGPTIQFRRELQFVTVLCLLVLVAYWPLSHSQFIHYDDGEYVFRNPHVTTGLSWPNIQWAFQAGYANNWHPLTWLSHMLDVQLFGLKPGAHHLVNLCWHITNTVLVFLLLQRLTLPFGSARWWPPCSGCILYMSSRLRGSRNARTC